MAALPENNTARIWFDYITGNLATSQEHTLLIRGFGPEVTTGDVQDYLFLFLSALGAANLRQGWRVQGVRLSQAGTNFSIPVPLVPDLASFVGTNTGSLAASEEAREWAWEGRSNTTGRRVSYSIFGIVGATPTNFRLVAGGASPTWVAASIAALGNASVPSTIGTTIDGSKPVWYSYVNVNYNSYWERRIRSV